MSFFKAAKHTQVGIIGGGISGLYFAYLCHQHGITYTIVEKSSKTGGAIDTFKHPDVSVTAELGAHTAYSSYFEFAKLVKELDLLSATRQKPKYPYYFLKVSRRVSLFRKIQYMETLPYLFSFLFFKNKSEIFSVKDKFSAMFGPKNWKNLFSHLMDGLLNQASSNFPASLVFKNRRQKSTLTPKKYSFQNGMSQCIEHLNRILNDHIYRNTEATHVHFNKDQSFFTFKTDKCLFTFDHLVLATPVKETTSLLQGIDSEMSRILKELSQETSLAVVVESDLTPGEKRLSGCIAEGSPFRTVLHFYPEKKSVSKFLSVFHFKIPVADNIEASIRTHYPFLKNMSIIFQKNNCMPSLTYKTHSALMEYQSQRRCPYFLIGNYFKGVALEDCILRAQDEFNALSIFMKQNVVNHDNL